MKQGIFLINKEGYFQIEDEVCKEEGLVVSIFDEDDQIWIKGTIKKDEFNEYYFTDGFLVMYLYEGLPGRIQEDSF